METRRGLFLFVIVGALFSVAVFALALSKEDIVFPVAELGNCGDEAVCRQYCGDFSHAEECFAFAKKYNLTRGQELKNAVASSLKKGGPGDCASEEECRTYCGDSAHGEECLTFAEKNGFMTKDELARGRKFLRMEGPGGCRGDQCRDYCADPARQEVCFEFAKTNGLIGEKEAKLAEKVLKSGGPGGCKGERECRAYCDDPAHLEECVAFAEEHELISQEDAARARKIAGKTGPGGCRGEECRTYCENPDHMEACLQFAEENDLMPPGEIARAKKIIGKIGPGGCRGNECRVYCENPDHTEACLQFAVENDLMPLEEAGRARKFIQASREGGPGGCRADECRAYCGDPAHREECFVFAKNKGLISEEDARDFDVGKKLDAVVAEKGGPGGCKSENECRAYCQDPARVEECIAFASAHGGIAADQARRMLEEFVRGAEGRGGSQGAGGFPRGEKFGPPRFGPEGTGSMEDRLRRFEEFRKLEEQFRGGQSSFPGQGGQGAPTPGGFGVSSGGGFSGPGGCTSPDVCIKYCFEHKEECARFGPPGITNMRPPRGVPGGIEGMPKGGMPSGILNPPSDYRSPREFLEKGFRGQGGFPQSGMGTGSFPGIPGSAGGFRPEDANIKGPGGCVGIECVRYCSDPNHRMECASFFAPATSGGFNGGGILPPRELLPPYPAGIMSPPPAGSFPPPGGDFPPPGDVSPELIPDDFDENGMPRGASEENFFGVILEPFVRIFR